MDQQSEDKRYQDYWRQAQGANQPVSRSEPQPAASQPQSSTRPFGAGQPQGTASPSQATPQQNHQQAGFQQPQGAAQAGYQQQAWQQPQYQQVAIQEPVVESASATTDHANNHATTATWGVLIGGAIAVVVLCLAMSSCVSSLIAAASYMYDYGYDDYGYNGYGQGWDDFELDDLGGYLDDDDSWPNAGWGAQNPIELQEGLELYLGYCDESLDLYVGASDYAGAQTSVRDYVKKVCSMDNAANEQVTSLVRTALATLDANGDPSQDLGSAVAAAKDAARQIEALEVPGDVSSSVKAELSQGVTACQGRWETAAHALQALLEGDDISEGDWRDLLAESAENPNNDAADDFLEALADSSAS